MGLNFPAFQRPVAVWDDYVYVCQKPECTRFFAPWMDEAYPYEEQARWLVASRRTDTDVTIVRCPQHISRKALATTIGYTKENRAWAEQAAEEDLPTHEAWSPLTPYPLDPRLLFGGLSLAESVSGQAKIKLRVALKYVD